MYFVDKYRPLLARTDRLTAARQQFLPNAQAHAVVPLLRLKLDLQSLRR